MMCTMITDPDQQHRDLGFKIPSRIYHVGSGGPLHCFSWPGLSAGLGSLLADIQRKLPQSSCQQAAAEGMACCPQVGAPQCPVCALHSQPKTPGGGIRGMLCRVYCLLLNVVDYPACFYGCGGGL